MNKIKIWMCFGFILILSIISIPAKASTNLIVKPSGNVSARAKAELRQFSHSNLEPTGLYMRKGDKITVTASNITKAKIFLGLMGKYSDLNGGTENNYKELDLKNGSNEFTMDIDFGKVYIENLSEVDDINISIDGGRTNPIYRLDTTNEEEFKNILKNNSDSPFFELVGKRIHALFRSSTDNIDALLKRDSVKALVEDLDATTVAESESGGLFYGDSPSLGNNYKSENRIYFYESDTNNAAAATNLRIILGRTAAKSILASTPTDNQWTLWHEEGHTYQNPYMKWGSDGDNGSYPFYNNNEVTVNITPIYLQHKKGIKGRLYTETGKRDSIQTYLSRSNVGKDFDTTSQGDFKPNTDASIWIKAGMFNQLMIAYGYDIFSYVNQEYRNMYYSGETMPVSNEEKRQCFMKIVSQVTKRNLTDYYEKWGLHPNNDTRDYMESYSKPSVPIEDNILPGNDEAIEDNVLPKFEVPTAIPKKAEFILGAQPNDYNLDNLIESGSLKNMPSGDKISPISQIITTNDLLDNSGVKVKLTNEEGQTNIISIPGEKSYGNAISMTAYQSEERAIYTLHKKTKTIETFTDESRTTPILSGEGTYVSFKLMDRNGEIKKEVSCNKGVPPQDFVHSLRDIPYSEGDVVEISVQDSGKLQSYKNGEVDLVRTKSTKKEYFRIVQDQFIHLSENDLVPTGTAVSQEVKLGDSIPEASKFIKDIKAPFGDDKVSVTLSTIPSINTIGDKDGAVTLKDSTTGLTSTVKVKMSVVYDNSLALAAYLKSDIRAVLRLDAKNSRIVCFSNPDRTTPINSAIENYWKVKIIRDGELVKEVSASGTDTPFDFAKALNGLEYQEGDLVYLYAAQKFIENYHESQLVADTYGNENYFKIMNNQFVQVSDSDPTLTVGNSHLLYEKGEALSEDELFKEGQVSTESGNQLSSDFTSELSKTLGEHIVTVTATNPVTGTKVSKTLTISIVNPSLVLKGSLGFTGGTNHMIINQPKEVHLAISGESGSSTAKALKLVHQFGADHLSLGKTLNQKLPGQEWESQGIEPNEPLTLSLDQMSTDESFEAKYDITASEVLSNKQGDQWHINYSYVNKVDGVEKTYTKTLDLSLDTETIDVPDNSGASQLQKKGMITFKDDNHPTYPVDPVNPVQPIVPDQPINSNGAELMITYASDLNFGKQSKSETSWHALADSVKDQVNSDSSRSVVPFVSVKDSRGTNRNGWKLEVTKDDDFKDDKGNILKGADLIYSNLNYADQTNMPVATSGSVTLSQSASVIAQADSTQGAGNTSLALGRLGENNQTSGVTLSVLPGTLINTKTYRTTITYELVAGV